MNVVRISVETPVVKAGEAMAVPGVNPMELAAESPMHIIPTAADEVAKLLRRRDFLRNPQRSIDITLLSSRHPDTQPTEASTMPEVQARAHAWQLSVTEQRLAALTIGRGDGIGEPFAEAA